jgi:hypothetical protein
VSVRDRKAAGGGAVRRRASGADRGRAGPCRQCRAAQGHRGAARQPLPHPAGNLVQRRVAHRRDEGLLRREVPRDLRRARRRPDADRQDQGRRRHLDPIHIIGAIVGEHTFNVDAFDTLQSYYVKALEYLHSASLRFSYKGEPIETFVARPEFAACADAKDDYALWTCRERVWDSDFRGKTVGGTTFPNDRFGRTFFQPFYAGQTFGLGQLNPLTALMMSDVAHAKSGLPLLDMRRAPEVYRAVMDPDMTLQYMAAIIRHDIDAYRDIAGFDISGNPGLTATLYNVGDSDTRAAMLAADNRKRRAAGLAPKLPVENYYGWLVNDRLDDLKKLLAGG